MTDAGWATVVAALITAVGAVVVGRFNRQQAKVAQARTIELQAKQIDADSYERARANYDAALAEQERRIERLNREMDRDRREHQRDVRELRRSIAQLEADREQDRERIRRLSADLLKISDWARGLVELLEHAGIDFPPAPVDLGTDPRLRLPRTPHDRPGTD